MGTAADAAAVGSRAGGEVVSLRALRTNIATAAVAVVIGSGIEIYNIEKYKGATIARAKTHAKGVFGKIATDVSFTDKGYKALHTRKETLFEARGESGIDHIYEKNGKYFIVESKYGASKLSLNPADGPQMGDDWIRGSNRLSNAVGKELADDIVDEGYIRILSNVSEDGTTILNEIDRFGKEIGNFIF